MTFKLSESETKSLKEFKEKIKFDNGLYGSFHIIFTPGPIGISVEVKSELTGEQINITDYSLW